MYYGSWIRLLCIEILSIAKNAMYLGVWVTQNDALLRTIFIGIHGNGKFQVIQFFFVVLM